MQTLLLQPFDCPQVFPSPPTELQLLLKRELMAGLPCRAAGWAQLLLSRLQGCSLRPAGSTAVPGHLQGASFPGTCLSLKSLSNPLM